MTTNHVLKNGSTVTISNLGDLLSLSKEDLSEVSAQLKDWLKIINSDRVGSSEANSLVNIPFKCPKCNESCKHVDTSSATLEIDCKDCENSKLELIGYKLSGYVSKEIADIVFGRTGEPLYSKDLYFIRGHIAGWYMVRAKQLGILETWLTPVYDKI